MGGGGNEITYVQFSPLNMLGGRRGGVKSPMYVFLL